MVHCFKITQMTFDFSGPFDSTPVDSKLVGGRVVWVVEWCGEAYPWHVAVILVPSRLMPHTKVDKTLAVTTLVAFALAMLRVPTVSSA